MPAPIPKAIENQMILLLASGYSQKEVADRLGISTVTLSRYSNKPDFEQKLNEAIRECYKASLARLVSRSGDIVDKLLDLILSPDTNPRVQIIAIQTYFQQLNKIDDLLLDERLERLENIAMGNKDVIEVEKVSSN